MKHRNYFYDYWKKQVNSAYGINGGDYMVWKGIDINIDTSPDWGSSYVYTSTVLLEEENTVIDSKGLLEVI